MAEVIAWFRDWFRARDERLAEEAAARNTVALLSGVDVDVILKAMEEIEDGEFVLTGTTALIIRGYKFNTDDIDFLCDKAPGGHEDGRGSGGSTQRKIESPRTGETVKVDFIWADKPRRRYLTRRPDIICGVPVASVKDVLAFKAFANREKDRLFLADWEARYGRIAA